MIIKSDEGIRLLEVGEEWILKREKEAKRPASPFDHRTVKSLLVGYAAGRCPWLTVMR